MSKTNQSNIRRISNIITQKPGRKLGLFFFIALLIALTIFPRIVEVLNGNYLFGFDQGREYVMTKRIVVDQKITLIGTELGAGSAGVSGIFHGPGYYYFLAIPFVLFGGDPYGGVVMMFLFSLATVIVGYFFGKKIFGSMYGILTAFFIAVSPPLISQARFLWSPNLTSLFILLAFYFVFKIQEKRMLFIVLAAFFSAFTYNFEFAVAVPMCLALFAYCLYLFRLSNLKRYGFVFIGFMLGFLPMILFESRHSFMGLRGLITYLFSAKTEAQTEVTLISVMQDRISYFLYVLFDTFPKPQIVPLIIVLLLLVGVYFILKEKNKPLKNFLIYLLVLILSSFLVFSFLKTPIYHYYLTHLNFIFILFMVYTVYSVYTKGYFKSTLAMSLLIFFILLPSLPYAYKTTINDYSDYGGIAKNKGLVDAIDFIYSDARGEKFNLLVFTPPVYTYQYDYMLWWYAKNKYSYLPGNEKKGLTYLWIEIDPHKPWSYKGWLETVIGEGEVLREKTLPSGFIIQKRNFN